MVACKRAQKMSRPQILQLLSEMGSLILLELTLHSKEDPLLTPITSAAVCLLKVRENLLRHVGELGYGPQIVTLLNKIAPVSPQDVVAISCIRLLHSFGDSRIVVQSISKANIPVVQPILSTLKPLHSESAFTLEVLKKILTANAAKPSTSGMPNGSDLGGAARSESQLIAEALKEEVNLVDFLTSILEAKADGIAENSQRRITTLRKSMQSIQ